MGNYNLSPGLQPLNYQGVSATSPPNMTIANTSPKTTFAYNVNEGDFWLNQATQQLYSLMKLTVVGANRVANWELLSTGAGSTLMLTGNDMVAVTPLAGNINVIANVNQGTARTTGSAHTLTLNFQDANRNIGIGTATLASLTSGINNVAYGNIALSSATSASLNSAVGSNALAVLVTGSNNCAMGNNCLTSISSGSNNTAIGATIGGNIGSGSNNVFIGQSAATNLMSGSSNIIIGTNSGDGYTAAESSNILIGNNGTVSESNVIHIGTQGSMAAQQNACFIAGIAGVTVANPQMVTVNTSTGQLGSTASVITNWVDVVTNTQAMAVNTGYVADDGATLITFTLPAVAAFGSVMRIAGKGSGLYTIAQNAGQTIHFGTLSSTTGATGSVASNAQYDAIELLCITANTDFSVLSSVGNFTVT